MVGELSVFHYVYYCKKFISFYNEQDPNDVHRKQMPTDIVQAGICYVNRSSEKELSNFEKFDHAHIPSMAAGAMPRIRHLALAIRRVGSARPEI